MSDFGAGDAGNLSTELDQDLTRQEDFDPLIGNTSRIAVIRTSDRINFRACRRRWGWQSHLRHALGTIQHASPLWFGSGMHYAWEDFHGPKLYGHAKNSFLAYVDATKRYVKAGGPGLPDDVDDLIPLGVAMMEYYCDHWLRNRDPLTTYIHDGVPQVEVHVIIPIDMDLLPPGIREHYDEVVYSATFDRVITDEYNRLWIVEYKTAKKMENSHLAIDPQVTAYMWLGANMYDRPIAGVIYQQHRKTIATGPKILANGTISGQTSGTTYALYRHAMKNLYGPNSEKWPAKNVDALNSLVREENSNKDLFVQRDYVGRSMNVCEAEGAKILLEIEDMLNPNLPLYPNPNRFTCSWCSFQHACIDMDDGADWQYDLELMFKRQPQERDTWRQYLQPPQ